jgi:hypothetical protein
MTITTWKREAHRAPSRSSLTATYIRINCERGATFRFRSRQLSADCAARAARTYHRRSTPRQLALADVGGQANTAKRRGRRRRRSNPTSVGRQREGREEAAARPTEGGAGGGTAALECAGLRSAQRRAAPCGESPSTRGCATHSFARWACTTGGARHLRRKQTASSVSARSRTCANGERRRPTEQDRARYPIHLNVPNARMSTRKRTQGAIGYSCNQSTLQPHHEPAAVVRCQDLPHTRRAAETSGVGSR